MHNDRRGGLENDADTVSANGLRLPFRLRLLTDFGKLVTSHHRNETDGNTGEHVECRHREIAVFHQRRILVHKRGESGETTAETGCQNEPRVSREPSSQGKSRHETNDETADDIDGERSQREGCRHPFCRHPRHQKPQTSAKKTANAHKEKAFQHRSSPTPPLRACRPSGVCLLFLSLLIIIFILQVSATDIRSPRIRSFDVPCLVVGTLADDDAKVVKKQLTAKALHY